MFSGYPFQTLFLPFGAITSHLRQIIAKLPFQIAVELTQTAHCFLIPYELAFSSIRFDRSNVKGLDLVSTHQRTSFYYLPLTRVVRTHRRVHKSLCWLLSTPSSMVRCRSNFFQHLVDLPPLKLLTTRLGHTDWRELSTHTEI